MTSFKKNSLMQFEHSITEREEGRGAAKLWANDDHHKNSCLALYSVL